MAIIGALRKPENRVRRPFLLTLTLLVSACSGTVPQLFSRLPVHRIDVRQGNFIDADMVAKLKPGMSRSQVRFVMGTPLLTDVFHPERWDYVYEDRRAGKLVTQRRVTLTFEGDRLSRIDDAALASEVPAAPAAVAETPRAPVQPTAAVAPATATAASSVSEAPAPAPATGSIAPSSAQPAPEATPESAATPRAQGEPPASFVMEPGIAALATAEPAAPVVASATENSPDAAMPDAQVMRVVQAWAEAWSRRDTEAYFAYYDARFTPQGGASLGTWRARREGVIRRAKSIEVRLDAPLVELIDAGRAEVRFRQEFTSDTYQDRVYKKLTLAKRDGVWRIVGEEVTGDRP